MPLFDRYWGSREAQARRADRDARLRRAAIACEDYRDPTAADRRAEEIEEERRRDFERYERFID